MKTLQIEIPEGFKIDSFDTTTGQIKFAPVPKDIFERVQSLQDAINELGEDDEEVKFLRFLEPIGKETHVYGRQEAVVIAKALNEGWLADYTNSNQSKYEARFYYDSSAGGFVFDDHDCWNSTAVVGSRLCFHSSELAKYFGNQFIEIHRKYL